MKTVIIGAGLAGLLAANMLRRSDVAVLEAQKQLPNNHHAVLRFRTDKVALQTGIPFRKVPVIKGIHESKNPVADALAYAAKVTGRPQLRSVIDTRPVERFIAPPDLISRMADGVNISYGRTVDGDELAQLRYHGYGIISTMPMNLLMAVLGYEGPRPDFSYQSGTVVKAKLKNADVFASLYYPHTLPCYRASITGDELAIETVHGPQNIDALRTVWAVMASFGLSPEHLESSDITVHNQAYAKLSVLSPEDRRRARDFMFWATTVHGVYSLGRFATWRAGLLMDDVVDDVAKIEGWMKAGLYDLRKDT
jgi:hypothetical protein